MLRSPRLLRGLRSLRAALPPRTAARCKGEDVRDACICAAVSAGGHFCSIHTASGALPAPGGALPPPLSRCRPARNMWCPTSGPASPSCSLLSRGPRGAQLARAGNWPAPSYPLPPGAPRPGAAGRPPPSRRRPRPQVRRDGPRERGRPGRGRGGGGGGGGGGCGGERGAAESRGGGGGAGRGAAAAAGRGRRAGGGGPRKLCVETALAAGPSGPSERRAERAGPRAARERLRAAGRAEREAGTRLGTERFPAAPSLRSWLGF